jgi:hypothetical protein
MANLLRNGQVSIDDIVAAYRNRIGNSPLMSAAMEEVREGGGILSVMEDHASMIFNKLGFHNLEVRRDSEVLNQYNTIHNDLQDDWSGSGFRPIRTHKGLMILEANGGTTSTAQILASYLEGSTSKGRAVCYVAGSPQILDATHIAQFLGRNAFQIQGIGLGIQGELGSGTNGNLPEAEQLLSVIQPISEKGGVNIKEILTYFILNTPQISPGDPRSQVMPTYFDFVNEDALFQKFEQISQEYILWRKDIVDTLKALKVDEFQMSLVSLGYIEKRLKNINTSSFLNMLKSSKLIKENDNFRQFIDLMQNHYGIDVAPIILGYVSTGNTDKRQLITDLLGSFPHIRPPSINKKEEEVLLQSKYISIAQNQGYEGEELIERVQSYLNGHIMVSQLRNPYYDELLKVMEILKSNSIIRSDDLQKARTLVQFCLDRLGFTY